jgi:E3 ubiquitin-protein ligase synoviolin
MFSISIAFGRGLSASKAALPGVLIRIVAESGDRSLCILLFSRRSVLENPAQEQQRAANPQLGAGQPMNFGNPVAPGNQPLAPRNVNNQPQPNATAQGWLHGQAPGVVIQYNIQYQGPPPSRDTSQATTAPQPVPPFPGFTGPDGQWHQWDMDPRWFGNAPPTEPTERILPHASAKPSGASNGDSRPTPRDAAATAASQRFGGNITQRSDNEVPEVTRSVSNISPTMPNSALAVPSIIPLHAHEVRTSRSTDMPHSHLWQPSTSSSHSDVIPAPRFDATVPTGTTQTPLHVLPPNLTDQQLMLMDQITREAIDERLRILEGVSVTVSRCVEDLTRVRSALPDSSNTPVSTEPQSHDTPPSHSIGEPI